MMKTSVILAMLFCVSAVVQAEDSDSGRVRAEQLFKNFDTNGDGGISLQEYRAGMVGNMSESRIEKVFREKDRNGDGRLDLGELLYVPMDQRAPVVPQKKDDRPAGTPAAKTEHAQNAASPEERLFRNFDRNGDGGISLDEYRAGMLGNMSESRVEKVFKEKDRNGDGKLSREELLYVPADQRRFSPDARKDHSKSATPHGADSSAR